MSEERSVLAALGRSARLLRGLRWLGLGLNLSYLFLVGIFRVLVMIGFRAMPGGARSISQGPPQTAMIAVYLVLAVLFQIVIAALFVQARRIADGPSAAEIGAVFA
jgi:hypothetical protein